MRRSLLVAAVCLRTGLVAGACLVAGCSGPPRPLLAFELSPPLALTYLRYRVRSSAGESTREFAIDRDEFAELRRVRDRNYVIGLSGTRGERAWMRVGTNPPVEIDGPLAADERRDAAWVGMRFADDESRSGPELESCHGPVCTFVHVPNGGAGLWVDVDRATRHPVGFSWITPERTVEACEHIEWNSEDGVPAVASASCSAIVDQVGRDVTSWRLEERRTGGGVPEWARVTPDQVLPLVPLRDVASFPIADPGSRIYVPAVAGGSSTLNLVVDTGSPWTIVSHSAMAALGVVPSLDPPPHVRPPYLPEATYECAIVDRLLLGNGVELHGVRVLVSPEDYPPFDGPESGLLGMDILSRFVTDVDAPASTLRLWPRGQFVADDTFVTLPYRGALTGRVVVSGQVAGVESEIPVLVDTGAAVNAIIGGPQVHARYPRHDGDEAMVLEGGDTSDYLAELDGFGLGPFVFPKMSAWGHERRPSLSFLDDDSGLVGLGVLRHFRTVIDTHDSVVYVAPGASYVVLSRFGLEVEGPKGAPTVTRVIDVEERAWTSDVRPGDVVRAVNGRAVATREEALAAIAEARAGVHLVLERRGKRVTRTLWAR